MGNLSTREWVTLIFGGTLGLSLIVLAIAVANRLGILSNLNLLDTTLIFFKDKLGLGLASGLAIIVFTIIAGYGVWKLIAEGDSVWPQRFAVASIAVLLVFGFLTGTKGERWVSDPAAQEAFVTMHDPENNMFAGDPKYMGYPNNAGRMVRGVHPKTGELLSPVDCRPTTPTQVSVLEEGEIKLVKKMLPIPHKGFDYAKDGLCVSPTDGITKMVPWETKHSPILPDLNPLETPAERAAEELREAQEKLGLTPAEVQARIIAQQAWEDAQPKPTEATVRESGRMLKKKAAEAGIEKHWNVYFDENQYHLFTLKPYHCPGWSPAGVGKPVLLEGTGNQYRFVPTTSYVQVDFLEIPPGKTMYGSTCPELKKAD